MKIPAVIRKNLKLILRSRVSALILLLGPLLIIMLVGLAFNTGQTLKVNVGYYSPVYNNLTQSFVDVLKTEQYSLQQYNSEGECKTAIAGGLAHICVVFPEDFAIANDKVNEVRFLVDNSKINLFESVVDSISGKFNSRALELSLGLTTELVTKLNETQAEVGSKLSTFEQLKTENKQMSDRVRAISRNMSSLNLSFNPGDFKMTELSSGTSSVSANAKSLRDRGQQAVDSGLDVIDEVQDFLDELELNSSDKENLIDLLNETKQDLLSYDSSINTTYNDASNQTRKLTSLIETAKGSLTKVEDRLKKAQAAKTSVQTSSTEIQKQLNSSLQKIQAVETSFNNIAKNIAGTQVTDVQTIVSPIVKKVEPVVTEESQLNFYFPYLIVLVIMFIGILLASTLLIMEKTSNAHFRNLITPTGDMVFIWGHFFTTFIILMLQSIVILLIYVFYFGRDITMSLVPTSIILFFVIGLFIMIGMIIGNLFGSEETGTLASISVASIFLFISDLVYPLEKMPPYVAGFAKQYNPFVYGTDLLRKAMVHQVSIDKLGTGILVLMAYFAGAFLLVVLIHKFSKKQYLLRAAGYVSRRQLGRKYKALDDEKLLQASKEVTLPFTSKSGKATSISELVDLTAKMSDEEINEHLEASEFSKWVKDSLKNEALADLLKKEKTKKGVLSVLRQAQKYYEKMEKSAKVKK